ncbi:hypothetical protein BH11PLA1_BH11PLA1_18350 [soil metagenome]
MANHLPLAIQPEGTAVYDNGQFVIYLRERPQAASPVTMNADELLRYLAWHEWVHAGCNDAFLEDAFLEKLCIAYQRYMQGRVDEAFVTKGGCASSRRRD